MGRGFSRISLIKHFLTQKFSFQFLICFILIFPLLKIDYTWFVKKSSKKFSWLKKVNFLKISLINSSAVINDLFYMQINKIHHMLHKLLLKQNVKKWIFLRNWQFIKSSNECFFSFKIPKDLTFMLFLLYFMFCILWSIRKTYSFCL